MQICNEEETTKYKKANAFLFNCNAMGHFFFAKNLDQISLFQFRKHNRKIRMDYYEMKLMFIQKATKKNKKIKMKTKNEMKPSRRMSACCKIGIVF